MMIHCQLEPEEHALMTREPKHEDFSFKNICNCRFQNSRPFYFDLDVLTLKQLETRGGMLKCLALLWVLR